MQSLKTLIAFPLYLLIFFTFLLSSCKGQENPKPLEENKIFDIPLFGQDLDKDDQIAEYIRNIFQDKNGNFWFGTNGYGVVHYDGKKLSYFSNKQGFSGAQITGITEDPQKNIWFATN